MFLGTAMMTFPASMRMARVGRRFGFLVALLWLAAKRRTEQLHRLRNQISKA
ncbi:hypothetical protein [Variovorax sp. MHTC-1]|uniref:hypothetical protein n=1 Tax=Variovorax sp. MHTC-1 TaxID=2495593 RepID=UPI0021AFDC67|nr:hypothetical protein [Variovorax sp. MHTC-1]